MDVLLSLCCLFFVHLMYLVLVCVVVEYWRAGTMNMQAAGGMCIGTTTVM